MNAFNPVEIIEDFKQMTSTGPGSWAAIPKIVCLIGIFILVLFLGYFFLWSEQQLDLSNKVDEESKLKQEYITKKSQSANINVYNKLLGDTEAAFSDLLRKLPAKIDLDGILKDINDAAKKNGVLISLIKPGVEVNKDIYVEQPIEVIALASYEQYGRFAAEIASVPRIITIANFKVSSDIKGNPYFEDSFRPIVHSRLIEFRATMKSFRAANKK